MSVQRRSIITFFLSWVDNPPPPAAAPFQNCNCRHGPDTCPMGGDCVHDDVVYGATVTPLDQNNLPLDDEAERYVGEAENWKSRFYTHNRSFTVRDPDIQTSLSNHIWDLKDENIQFSITWQVLEKSKSFNPISLQCLLCLSEATQILTKPNLATLNSRSETYGFCRHRKKYLLKNVKPLAFKGGALTYRYKD